MYESDHLNYLNRILKFSRNCVINFFKHIFTNLWNDSFLSFLLFSHHCVRFSSPSLSISKYTNIVTWKVKIFCTAYEDLS